MLTLIGQQSSRSCSENTGSSDIDDMESDDELNEVSKEKNVM